MHLVSVETSMVAKLLLAVAILALTTPAWARDHRSRAVTREFQWEHPCPSTGRTTGACPGYVKDHVIPLCADGPDAVSNMQWQTIEDGLTKDKIEHRMCGR
jgi:hypothetical protein